jgi:hypothetical protein
MAKLNRYTSGCNSTQSAKSASATDSSAFRGRNLTATLTLPGTSENTTLTSYFQFSHVIIKFTVIFSPNFADPDFFSLRILFLIITEKLNIANSNGIKA